MSQFIKMTKKLAVCESPAKIKPIGDVLKKFNVDMYVGIGGGPEGVLSASALDAYNCQFQGRFIFEDNKDIKTRLNERH